LNTPAKTDPAKNPDIATADIVYGGSLVKWKKLQIHSG
jgi:hypothetical protein